MHVCVCETPHPHIYQYSAFYVDGQLYEGSADIEMIETAFTFFKDGLSYAGQVYSDRTYELLLEPSEWADMDSELPKMFDELSSDRLTLKPDTF